MGAVVGAGRSLNLRGTSGVGCQSRDVVGRWMLLLVALGGLFAMHGLSDHGVGGPAAVASPTASAATAMAHADAHGETSNDARPAIHAGDPAASDGEDRAGLTTGLPAGQGGGAHGDHHGGVLVGMCLAVLAAVMAFSICAWRARVLVRLRGVGHDPAVAAATAFWARARGPAPPDLRMLSILRC
ncbi:hypothetical protein GCM10023350_36710 [Nocardioides endophyticus]|uniref:Uncharacterized protein n=1 Tax=Nocardioides endophyticus TaxID=1353775 RepID=A0ABP8Z779_9ACTN